MSLIRRLLPALGCAALAILCAAAVARPPLRLVPGTPLWRRAVLGAPAGVLTRDAVVTLPGLGRRSPSAVRLELAPGGARATVGVSFGAEARWARVSGGAPGLWTAPPADVPGLRIRLLPGAGAEGARVAAIEVRPGSLPWRRAAAAGVLAALGTLGLPIVPAAARVPASLWLAGLAAMTAVPQLLLWAVPASGALLRLAGAAAPLLLAVALALRRRALAAFWPAAALLAAGVFGLWVRGYFAPSYGGWDTDYWKAIAAHAEQHGFTRVYGGPDAVPPGRFLDQLRGREPIFQVEGFGRSFVVDQPPGIQMLWAGSWWLVRHGLDLSHAEAQNVAAKLPALLGDALAVVVLVWALPGRRGALLAALYWALPISWLSGAVLGFFDGAQAPLAVAALVAAGRGRAVCAGALLAAAALVKSTALIVLPAAAMALWVARAPIRRGVAAGLALVALALLPFALDGTLDTAVVHVYRILFQERLSGGFANLWWLASHALSLGVDGRGAADPIPFVRIEALPLPARPLGVALFAAVAGYTLACQRSAPGARAAAIAGATLILGYAMLAIGVHENHPHGLYLTLLATGLGTRRLRWTAGALIATGVLNMLCLSGLGRFYGLRYAGIERLAAAAEALRTAPGFDLTLPLAAVNLAVLAVWLAGLRRELALAAAHPAAPSRDDRGG